MDEITRFQTTWPLEDLAQTIQESLPHPDSCPEGYDVYVAILDVLKTELHVAGGPNAERAMWTARGCLDSYLRYGDWGEHTKYGTQKAFDELTEVLIPDV